MNPALKQLRPYPFEKLRQLFSGLSANKELYEIKFGIGEPQHPTPQFILDAVGQNLTTLAQYPSTQGSPALRQAIANWLCQRYEQLQLDPESEILPVNGSREALFAITQTILDSSQGVPLVASPNPFYQIYEGACILAGGEMRYLDSRQENNYIINYQQISQQDWEKVQLLFVCSPNNPTGHVMQLDEWRELFNYADRFGFVIVSDECYSEIYPDEANPPLGALQAAAKLGRDNQRLLMFSSLSKRSNVPGLRSGFVAGDKKLIKAFLLYRTYHGSAMNPHVQSISTVAWQDEEHVRLNRQLYREKFAAVLNILNKQLPEVSVPDASFYLWLKTPLVDEFLAQKLYAEYNLTVLPGSYMARQGKDGNPGSNFLRIALVAHLSECIAGSERIISCLTKYS